MGAVDEDGACDSERSAVADQTQLGGHINLHHCLMDRDRLMVLLLLVTVTSLRRRLSCFSPLTRSLLLSPREGLGRRGRRDKRGGRGNMRG